MFDNLKPRRFNTRKYRENIVSEELWKKWKDSTSRTETFKEFRDIWHKIADQIIVNVVEETDGVRLPKGNGDIYIGYIPHIQKRVIDYKLSKQYGKVIRHENWNSNNKVAKIIYGTSRRKYIYKLAGWWGFTACRNFKVRVVKALQTHPERYKNSIEKRSGK
jgi:hypothetical protein